MEKTIVFESYWKFAAERQNVFFRRLSSPSSNWTNDPIIASYKFTNSYRASDRVSQYLIKNVIYRKDLSNSPEEILFRILLFKLFNKIETWELLENSLGHISLKDYKFDHYDNILNSAKLSGQTIYSGAYIMPSGKSSFGFSEKHRNNLKLLELILKNSNFLKNLANIRSMKQIFELLVELPTMGNFLAYQLTIDINYSELTDFSEMDFVVPGPGAKDGIRKCFKGKTLSESEIIKWMADNQEEEFEKLGITFSSLWGRKLQLIDCQNLFCETDKYSRVAHPEVSGITGRTRIKQKFKSSSQLSKPWYPPKWNLNEKIDLYFNELNINEVQIKYFYNSQKQILIDL